MEKKKRRKQASLISAACFTPLALLIKILVIWFAEAKPASGPLGRRPFGATCLLSAATFRFRKTSLTCQAFTRRIRLFPAHSSRSENIFFFFFSVCFFTHWLLGPAKCLCRHNAVFLSEKLENGLRRVVDHLNPDEPGTQTTEQQLGSSSSPPPVISASIYTTSLVRLCLHFYPGANSLCHLRLPTEASDWRRKGLPGFWGSRETVC